MKPLAQTQLQTFLKRFENFKDAELRSLKILSPTAMQLTLAVQDSARAFDWITITLEFNGVSDAKLLDEQQLLFIDMSEGISLIFEDNLFAFGISECYNISSIKNSSLYLIAESLKYEEGQF
ncbi:MAG: hypothetical protein JXQ67_02080 [Campylobacterales bacterium]|nr:hypothetical protein [Campylobacterales bacterium]